MFILRKGDKVVTVVEVRSFSDTGANKALSAVRILPAGSTGIVVNVLTDVSGDGRTVAAEFDGEILYVREDCLKTIEAETEESLPNS